MRIATWNLDAEWSPRHAAFVRDLAADVLCLTEVPPAAIADGRIEGYHAVESTGRMSRGQAFAVIAARVAPTAPRHPHPATVVADVGGLAVAASVLPWAQACDPRQPAGVWTGGRLDEWLAQARTAIQAASPTIWAGDFNANLQGKWQNVCTVAGLAEIRNAVAAMGMVAPTAPLPHRIPGLFSIDHIAIPASWRITAAERVAAGDLSDHDVYIVVAEPAA